jgi:hypothetical protein
MALGVIYTDAHGAPCAAPSRKVIPMKTLILPLLLASASAVTFAVDNTSLSGKWQVHSSVAGNDNDQSCTFTQKDKDLTGTCSTNDNKTVNITGKVDGKKVSWSYKSEYNGSPLTVNYEGKLDSDSKITGTTSVPEFSVDGDFTATQSK